MYSGFFISDTMFLRWEVAAKNFRFNKWEKFFDRKDPPNKLFTLLKKLGCLQYYKFFLWKYTSPTLVKILVYLLILIFLEIPCSGPVRLNQKWPFSGLKFWVWDPNIFSDLNPSKSLLIKVWFELFSALCNCWLVNTSQTTPTLNLDFPVITD